MKIVGGVNEYIGRRIRLRRDMLGMTQKQLAERCGVTFQQIQKYENGGTRIVAERLVQLGSILDMPVSFLFSGLPNQTPASDFISISRANELRANSPDEGDPLGKNESLELVKLFWNLPNDEARNTIMSLLRSMQSISV
ncbi:MAG: helix-turn-helix domain-containing protein [Rickettsiales bacterium]|jgi:transcriptional regulator with XRE-family HTH domain|nr:helix-turn-helix domain-containing protein [Rickettsiales bacterium]